MVMFPDRQPVKTGVIEFQSVNHPLTARGKIQRDGSFELGTYEQADGAVAGKHRAIVVQVLAADSIAGVKHDHGGAVDRKFADYGTSKLEYTVEPRENQFTVIVTPAEGNASRQ
ncbi:MAG: hypothetical protein WDZ59_12330 [Pirellulales bacterium]